MSLQCYCSLSRALNSKGLLRVYSPIILDHQRQYDGFLNKPIPLVLYGF